MAIKNFTYRNLMIIANRIKQKGYTEQEAFNIAKNLFKEFNPKGLPIETLANRVLTKAEWERENNICSIVAIKNEPLQDDSEPITGYKVFVPFYGWIDGFGTEWTIRDIKRYIKETFHIKEEITLQWK